MLYAYFSRFFLLLLVAITPLQIISRSHGLVTNVSTFDNEIISKNNEAEYVCFDEKLSPIVQVLYEIGKLDNNSDSPIHVINKQIARGFSRVEYNSIVEALECAEDVLQYNYEKLNVEQARFLTANLHTVINQITQGTFQIDIQNNQDPNALIGKTATFEDVHVKKSLSVTDLFVAHCVKNLCINKLSTGDATIQKLTLTESMSSPKLSVADATVGKTLSVTNEVINNKLHFVDKIGGKSIGLRAPNIVPTSYMLSLPSTIPTAHQVLRANATTATNLEWSTTATAIDPMESKTMYVAKRGDDGAGNGSFDFPYATLAKAISIANGIASSSCPITILVSPGTYIENNSSSPIIVTAPGISIRGDSAGSVIILPNTPINDLLLINDTIQISNLTFQSTDPLATGIILTAGRLSVFDSVRIVNFLTGISCSGTPSDTYGFVTCFFINNGIALYNNNASIECNSCTIFGVDSPVNSAANTGVAMTGSHARMVFEGGLCGLCTTGFTITDNSFCTINSVSFRHNTFGIVQDGASHVVLSACNFELTNGTTEIDMQVSGAGTTAEIIGCEFNGNSVDGIPQGIGLCVTDNAFVGINSSGMRNYDTAITIGLAEDSSSTILTASNVVIRDCATDIVQKGSTTLSFNAGTATSSKIHVDDPAHVAFGFFDLDHNGVISIGTFDNRDTTLMQAEVSTKNNPRIEYKSSLYSSRAMGFENPGNNPSSWFVISPKKSNLSGITTDRTKESCLQLISDSGSTVGGTTALRGWNINKNGSDAELSFKYQNTDIVGQTTIAPYTILQLDGVNNQMQFPSKKTQIIFAGDTNLYRSGAHVLQTDNNFIVGALKPGHVVTTNEVTNQLTSSAVTGTELGYVSGVTSSIQTQLQDKISKSGDSMTGALELPAGSASLPSLIFTDSIMTGISAHKNKLLFSTNAQERMKINSRGVVSINNLNSAGVMHNDVSGNISTSLIVNTDIANATISNEKLATISSSNTANTVVVRDVTGNFEANMISLAGSVANPTNVATKAYVDAAIASNINHNFSAEEYTVTADNQVCTVTSTTSLLLLSSDEDRRNLTITFPVSPANGQFFTILLITDHTIEIINDGNTAHVVNGITSLTGAGVTYVYLAATNRWYRYSRT